MNNTSKIIRLEPLGPENIGLTEMELDPADFQSDLPEQHIHLYFEDEASGLTVGVWTTTDMQEAFGPYPGDEFMCILEGQVALVDCDGNETIVNQGNTFCVRNAIPISWKQVGFLRKFFMTYSNPGRPTPEITSAEGGVMVLDESALESGLTIMETTAPFEIAGILPLQRDNNRFTNDAGNMFAGMWDSTSFESEMKPFPCHEFVQLLEGEVTISQDNGAVHEFRAGDVFFVPMGNGMLVESRRLYQEILLDFRSQCMKLNLGAPAQYTAALPIS